MSATEVSQEAVVAAYYERFASKAGYALLLQDERHFGLHPPDGSVLPDALARAARQIRIATDLGLHAGMKVLDVGCGSGVVSRKLAAAYDAQVDGINITPRDIRLSQARAAREGLPNRYLLMNVLDMPFENEYDGIYTTEILSHVPDIPRALDRIFAALRPGGSVSFSEYTVMPDEEIAEDPRLQQLYPKGELVIAASGLYGIKQVRHGGWEALMAAAGFTDVDVEDQTKRVLPSIERLHRLTLPLQHLFEQLGVIDQHPGTLTAKYLPELCASNVFTYTYVTATKPA